MKLSLTIDQQNELFAAFTQIDSHDVVTPGVENGARAVRAPYRLGPHRRSVVKNMSALRTSLIEWEAVRKGLLREHFPEAGDFGDVDPKKNPDAARALHSAIAEAAARQDEFDLHPLPEKVVYDDNEMPLVAVTVLDSHGLISG